MRIEGQGVGVRGRWSYRGNEGGTDGKKKGGGGGVFAFGVSLTQSNSSRQGNLCGQRTP